MIYIQALLLIGFIIQTLRVKGLENRNEWQAQMLEALTTKLGVLEDKLSQPKPLEGSPY